MTIDPETLARTLESTRPLFLRFLAGFDDSNRTRQADGLPNHVAWTLGHCALTMHRVAERYLNDGRSLPESDFFTGSGASGTKDRFDTESVCFASAPVDDPERYPTIERSRDIFESACDRFARAIREISPDRLNESIPWHDGEMPLYALVMRICFHNATHAGQLTDLRRALGLPPVIAG